MITKLRTIPSHVGYARYLAEVEDTELSVAAQADIHSPYAFGPTWPVYRHWADGLVIILETSHRKYTVFHVTSESCLCVEES